MATASQIVARLLLCSSTNRVGYERRARVREGHGFEKGTGSCNTCTTQKSTRKHSSRYQAATGSFRDVHSGFRKIEQSKETVVKSTWKTLQSLVFQHLNVGRGLWHFTHTCSLSSSAVRIPCIDTLLAQVQSSVQPWFNEVLKLFVSSRRNCANDKHERHTPKRYGQLHCGDGAGPARPQSWKNSSARHRVFPSHSFKKNTNSNS
eukprot:g5005.t1